MRTSARFRQHVPVIVLFAATCLAGLSSCGETGISAPLPAARMQAPSTANLTGPAGSALPEPVAVVVFGSDDQPLAGAVTTFSANNGGSVDPVTVPTDENGVARTRWTLGTTAGENVLTATASNGVSTTITATVTAARAATVSAVAGNNQTAPAGNAVPVAPGVRVSDQYGNLVEDAPVTFSVLSGGGSATGAFRTTGAQGVATVGSWTLGPVTGIQTLVARVEESGVSNNPVLFTATATTPTGAQMVLTAGNNQQAPVGRLVPVAPAVQVRNAAGAGVPGVVVTFAVASGGGSVVGAQQVTDATGTAAVGGWFLGPLPGPNTLTAASQGLPNVTFAATGLAGTAVSMAAVSQTTQSAAIGTNVSDPPAVIVRDAQGIPVAGIIVTFNVTAGGGTVTAPPAPQDPLLPGEAMTNANGIASLTSWRLGTVVGPNTVTATSPGLPSVTFNATGTAGAPANVVASAGTGQTAVQGTSVAVRPTVRVTDSTGNPVIGATVTFAATAGGGSATSLVQTTDTQGQAAVGSWTLGSGAPNTLRATVTGSGITGNPVTFTAQSATQIAITSAPAGPISLGTNFTISVQLRDGLGAAVALPGVSLTIAIASGGGTLNGTLTRVTDASGAVSFTLINVTGSAGARTFTVTGAGLTSATTASINFN